VEALEAHGVFVFEESVRAGISGVEWPGRMEVARRDPLVILDGAQNPASARALIEGIERHFGNRRSDRYRV